MSYIYDCNFSEIMPNLVIVLQIYLTLTVSVATVSEVFIN